jgi:hypothetical protein
MAVIRQKTQVFNQPVGVVRADAGAGQIGRAISNAASRLSDLAYRDAVINAEKAGQQAAKAQSSSRIVSIDPDTNMPVAYDPPASFGSIASRSYQNMIDRRFEESILNEFAAKGAEFAASSTTAAQYKTRMTNYIQEMYSSEGEATPYSRYIGEAGKEYVASTYSTLAKKEAEAAKKALQKQQLLSGYVDEQKLANLIAAGADSEEISALGDSLRARYLDLFNTEGITFSAWSSANDRVSGLQGLSANNALVDIYSRLSSSEQSLFKLGLTDPKIMAQLSNKLENPNLEGLAIAAKTQTSIPTLIAALDSFASISEDYVEDEVNSIVSELAPILTASNIGEIIPKLEAIEDPQIRREASVEIFSNWVEKNLDLAGKKASDIDMISEALQNSASPDFKAIEDLIGGDMGKLVAKHIQRMTPEQRSDLATEISDRRAALNSMENVADREKENNLRQKLTDFAEAVDLRDAYKRAITGIETSGLDEQTQQTLITRAKENYAEESRIRADKILLSTAELQELSDAVKRSSTDLDGNVRQAWELLRPAYESAPASTEAYLSRRLKGSTNENNRYLNGVRMDAIEGNLSTASEDDVAFYDKQLFGNVTVTAANMFEFPKIVEALNKGVILPSVKTAMESALTSNDEAAFNTAIQTFERFSNLEAVTEDGRRTDLDIMRKSLSPDAYALYSAISNSARDEGVEPLSIALEFRNYEGNIDADIKLDLELPKNANIRRALDAYPMSDNYRKEILSMLRLQKVRGNKITDDSISSIIDNYTSKMATDPNVIGPYIGDSAVYARNIYITDSEVIENREQLTDALADSGMFDDLLRGDTVLDSAVAGFLNAIGGNAVVATQSVIQQFTTGVGASETLSDRNRIRQGLAALNIELTYKPVVSSFNQGVPMYEVGYINDYGGFEPIIINDTPWTLSKKVDVVAKKGEMRLQALNMFQSAVKADAPLGDKAIAEINYLATLEHITEDQFISSATKMRQWGRIFNDDDMALNIFREKRKLYDGLSDPLRIRITEGAESEE